MCKRFLLSFLLAFALVSVSTAQNIGVGEWRMHLPFYDPVGVTFSGPYMYSWTKLGFFRYHRQEKELEVLSKINGFTDFQVSTLRYNRDLGVMVIAYANSNIDLLWDNREIQNVVDIFRSSSITGSRQINEIYFYQDYVFFSCAFGVYVYDLKKKETAATYYVDNRVGNINDLEIFNGKVYAAADSGVYTANLPSSGVFIPNNSWQREKTGFARFIDQENSALYAVCDSSLFTYNGSWQQLVADDDYRAMVNSNGKLIITTASGYTVYGNGTPVFTPLTGSQYTVFDENGRLWYASQGYGVIHINASGGQDYIFPAGPRSSLTGKMVSKGKVLWVAGGYMYDGGGATFRTNGFYRFEDGNWTNSLTQGYPFLDTVRDIHAMALDPNSDDIWMGALLQGVYRISGNQLMAFYNNDNSPISITNPENITALAFDNKKNLWVGNFAAATPLLVRTPTGTWNSFSLGSSYTKVLEVIVDKNNFKWCRLGGGVGSSSGIMVYNDNNTPLNKNDDVQRYLSSASGGGGLPDNAVNCFAADRNGQIWVGTVKGLTVFNSPSNLFSASPSDAKQIVVTGAGGVLGYLLGDESITAILVDGGNRKWIASRSGLWLVSPDGQQVLAHFSEENSPLLSNNISQLGMVEETGELFIATDKGIISFRTASSTGGDTHSNVKVFPNPVRPDYEGSINISGLPQDAYVKITDISGNLIYETQANGGTASWDGKNFSGRRAATGVYLVFSGNKDASDTFVSKILFIGR